MIRSILIAVVVGAFASICYAGACGTYNCHEVHPTNPSGPHNFKRSDGVDASPCAPCHKPHNAGSFVPLWNDINKFDDGPAYTAYTSPSGTLDNIIDSTINPASEACMTCHDGMSESTGFVKEDFTGMGRLDIDYAKANHPIGIEYDSSKDSGLNPSVSGGVITGTFGSFKLINNKVECLTCHDPHKKQNSLVWNADVKKLLRTTDFNSFCNECHITK